MSDRPILFRAEMVRAILKGDKTQTRRVIKPQPWVDNMGNACWKDRNFGQNANHVPHIKALASPIPCIDTKRVLCPYGAPGDLLWVRETCWAESVGEGGDGVRYAADHAWRIIENTQEASEAWCQLLQYGGDYGHDNESNIGRRVPPIHMPRWASRITLRITDVRVERLQDISEDDARAEGATMRPACNGFQHRYPGWSMDWSEVGKPSHFATGAQRGKKAPLTESDVSLGSAKWAFASLWNTINGPSAWDANPWVWVIAFERAKP